MTLQSSIAFCGSLVSIIILISSQYQPALGQDDSSTESEKFTVAEQTGGEGAVVDRDDERCPCVLRSECPRIYGLNPLDFREIGHVGPCKEDGYVRCCGVDVSVVQQTDQSPPVAELDEDTTWGSGHEQLEPSEEENSSHEDDKDDLHESQGHEPTDGKQPEAEEGGEEADETGDDHYDEMEKATDEEHLEDHMPAESRQEAQTVMVEPTGLSPRQPFLRKFHRYRRPTGGAVSSQEHNMPGSSSSGESGNENSSSEGNVSEGGEKLHPSKNPSGSVVYSQRVTDFPAYRLRNNKNNVPNTDSGSNDLLKVSTGPMSDDNGESSPVNVENRPRFPIKRRRPINRMRNRAQLTHQQETVGNDNRNPVDTEDGKDQSGVNGASASSSAHNSPANVHISIQTTGEGTQDELDNQARPMSRLVRPRVNVLNRGRKRPAAIGSGEQSESLHSNNSDGPAPILENGEKLPHDLEREKVLPVMENGHISKATIGSADVSTEPLPSSEKLFQNSPTGQLAPLRPKIRSFSRKTPNHMLKADGATASESGDSLNNDINQSEGLPDVGPEEDAKLGQPTQTRPSGVIIRRVPVRRVKPVIVDIGNDSQNVMNVDDTPRLPTSPVKGRPIMRRPISSLLKNKQASLADHKTLLEGVQTPAEPQEQSEVKIEKLDVRERFRGRHRNTPLKASTPSPTTETSSNGESSGEHENMDNPAEHLASSLAHTTSGEPKRPNILRKRIRPLHRPSALGQGHAKQSDGENDGKAAENNDADNVKALTSANPEASISDEENEDKSSGQIPRVKIRIKSRFPSLQRGQQQQETASDSSTPIPSPEETANAESAELSNALRQRQRLTSNRGTLRRVQSTPILSAPSAVDKESGLSDVPATSETPVTVTSTYSRIRVNNKNGFPARPIFRRPSSITKTEETEIVISTPDESPSAIKETQPIRDNASGTRSRFAVQSRFPVRKSEIEPTQAEASDKELEKQGQLSQLNENPEDNSSHVPEKRVGFGQRKRVRVRVRPQHNSAQQDEKLQDNNGEEQQKQQQEEQQQQQLLSNAEKKHEADQVGSNPGTGNSEHVVSEDTVAYETPSITLPLNSNQEPEELSPSSGSETPDEVKILPVRELSSETEHTGGGKDHVRVHNHHEADDSKSHFDDEQTESEKYNLQNPPAELDIDAYDLILNKDVRKTLGSQSTHSTHNAGLPGAYQVDRENDSSAILHSSSPSYHSSQDDNQDNYDDQYSIDEHRKSLESEDEHKYSSGIRHGHHSTRPAHSTSRVQGETDDMGNIETLELGTPDYEDSPPLSSYNEWQSYDDYMDEDEGESRVQEKFLANNRTRFNKSSLVTKEHKRVQKGDRIRNEDRQVDSSLTKVGPSTSHNSLNPFSGASYTSQSEPSTTTSTTTRPRASDDAIKARERIRQKLRRPPSAYISNSEGSGLTSQKTDSAPFTPSIASPRPTYSGHEALLESVNQSVASLPKSETVPSYPDSKPLEQFIKNKQLVAPRNRTRVRVKLVTMPTTTPTPYVSGNDHYEENGNEKDAASDASLPRRPTHSGFSFPPFQKSKLSLITSTEAPFVEPQSVSYRPQQVIFNPSPITTTPTPTTRRPFKTIKDNYDKVSVSPGHTSSSSGAHVAGQNLTSHKNKYGTRQRFKVSELNSSTDPSSSTVQTTSSSPIPANEHVEPVRKPQIRLRAPEYRRISTTSAPIRHPQLSSIRPSTSSPIYSSKVNQSPTWQEDVMTSSIPQQPPPVLASNEQYNSRPVASPAYKEVEPDNISIRITSQPTDLIDYDTALLENEEDEELQYVPGIRQQENVIQNAEPNYISHLPPPPPTKHVGKESSTYSNTGAASTQKGKYSSRFKVPEKFQQQNTNSALESNGVNNRIKSLPAHIALEAERERPINVVERENDFKNKYLYENAVDINVEPEPLPSPPQQSYQPQTYDESPVHLYQNPVNFNVNMPQEEPPAYSNVPSHFEEVNPAEPEFVPDIRINVFPPTPTHYDGEHVNQHGVQHAVRDRPSPLPPQRNPSVSNVLKQGPFGPFPSTDHWSGIPSANSPKLPEFFEQNEETSPPTRFEEIKTDIETDWRILPKPEPRPHVPAVRFPDDKNVHFKEDNENLSLPPPVQATSIQFGTDFDKEEEEKEVEHRRPTNFPNNVNVHGNQLQQRPMEFAHFNGNQESHRPPLGAPHPPPPANFPHRPIPTVIVPPQSSVVIPVPLPGHLFPPSNNDHLKRPHHQNVQHQSSAPRFPSNEPPKFINKPEHHQQEHSVGGLPHGLRPNPIPARPHEMKEAEFTNPQFRLHHGDGAIQDLQLRQPHPQFSQNHQPNGNAFRVNERPHQLQNPNHHHQQINPPHPHPNMGETFSKPEGQREPLFHQPPHFKSQDAPAPSNAPNHVGQRHPDEPLRYVNQQNLEKPLERPHGNVVFEKDPESRPINGPQLANNLPPHPSVNTRDHLQRPLQPLQPPKPQVKLPESISQEFGDQQTPPPRPGQYGPPSQLQLPQYVPFNMGQERPLRNESEKQVHNIQPRPPHPMHPQGLQQQQQPAKFSGAHTFPPFSQPPRQNPNGNSVSPQQYAPQHRPQPQTMMPGFPKGPLPNNPYFQQQQRIRNPNARTSRAANLTAEEEKAKNNGNSQLPFQTEEESAMEQDNQPDQQALFLLQNLTTSSEGHQPQLLVSNNTNGGIQDREDKARGKVSQFDTDPQPSSSLPEAILDEQLIPTSVVNPDIPLEKLADSTSQRQERELKLDGVLEGSQQAEEDKERRDVLQGEENSQDAEDLIAEESIPVENFVQDRLPEEILESSDSQGISHPYHLLSSSPETLDSAQENTQGAEQTGDSLKLSKQKNFRGHKGKQEKRFTLLKSSDFPIEEKLALGESKKGGIMKIKGLKAKSEQQQHLAKFKEVIKTEKKQQTNNDIPEQQEFVAPTLVQRGFHPILPYSEKDPGPILVQIPPKVEKLLPPSTDLKDNGEGNMNGNRLESGTTSQVFASSSSNPSLLGLFGLNAFKHLQDPMFFTNKPINQIPLGVQTNVLNTYP